jgi:PAS domain S-box-containing protein
MQKRFDQPVADDWDEQRRKIIGLGESSFRKSYYPELLSKTVNVKNLLLAVEQSPRGVFICVRDGSIEYANGTLLALSGCSSEDLIGKTPHALWSNAVHGDRCEMVMQRIAAGLPWQGDLRLKDKCGKEIWVQTSIAPILDDAGDLTHFLGGMEDISIRKRVEEELTAIAEARARALEAAEHLSTLKSEFMANMSHELRTPLNGILGFAEIGCLMDQTPARARATFKKIKEAGKHLLALVTDVLDFAKIDAGKLAIENAEFQLIEVVEQAAASMRDRALAKRLDLHVELAADLPSACLGDAFRIKQILLNLLSNAVKFTDAGNVTLSVWRADEELVFRIADTGVGLSKEQLDKVFNPFQQADGSSSRRFGGMGLGLAISHRLLELMNGDIRIDSQPGIGTTVEFCLPLLPLPCSPKINPGSSSVTSPFPKTGAVRPEC